MKVGDKLYIVNDSFWVKHKPTLLTSTVLRVGPKRATIKAFTFSFNSYLYKDASGEWNLEGAATTPEEAWAKYRERVKAAIEVTEKQLELYRKNLAIAEKH